MWVSSYVSGAARQPRSRARVGTVTVTGARSAVLTGAEQRGLGVAHPGGMFWHPGQDQAVLVLETDDGERFILGAVEEDDSVAAGELCLKNGTGCLKLGSDGKLSAEGESHLSGDVFITGRLFLNGVEVTAAAPEDEEDA